MANATALSSASPELGNEKRLSWMDAVIIAILILGTMALYARTAHFEFTNFDDSVYVYENPHVTGGLSFDNIVWAFKTDFAANWHPLVWVSLMLDVSIFGVKSGQMHIENALLHAINAALLFLVLLRMTSCRWPSAWVAAMFAWHPLHVESVAWVTERKDTLSTLFWLLCMIWYVRYVRGRSKRDYWIAVVMLAVGLMCKPMLVTLPFVLLLMDYWPLKRPARVWEIVKEKGWMFGVVVASAVATFAAQSAGRSVIPIHNLPLSARFANATTACAIYLRQMFWPTRLAIFYPMTIADNEGHVFFRPVLISAGILVAITVIVTLLRRQKPWGLIGWLWYLGTLVPVIGIVQVGSQAHADRYTYVPSIGIFVALAWCAVALIGRFRSLRGPIAVLAVASLIGAATMSWRQIGYWRDTVALMNHAIDVVPDNFVAYSSLGEALDSRGDHTAAAAAYHKSLSIQPNEATALYDLALQALVAHDDDQAYTLLREAIFADRYFAPAYNNFGNILARRGKIDDAIDVYRKGIHYDPNSAQLRHNLALALAGEGKLDDAIDQWHTALEIDPNYADAHEQLGNALLIKGDSREGIAELRQAIQLNPNGMTALRSLAWTLATHPNPLYQNGPEAEQLAKKAVDLSGGNDPQALDTLAAAYARQAKFADAIKADQQAQTLADRWHLIDLQRQIEGRIKRYENEQPFTSGR